MRKLALKDWRRANIEWQEEQAMVATVALLNHPAMRDLNRYDRTMIDRCRSGRLLQCWSRCRNEWYSSRLHDGIGQRVDAFIIRKPWYPWSLGDWR